MLAVVVGLYLQHALSYLSSREQADDELTAVRRLQRENSQLEREQQSLGNPATIVARARSYGMVMQGERSYSITGLPAH